MTGNDSVDENGSLSDSFVVVIDNTIIVHTYMSKGVNVVRRVIF